MHACEKVHLYGFNTQTSLKQQGYHALKNWYFDKRGNDGGKPIPISGWARWADTSFPNWNWYSGPLRVRAQSWARFVRGRWEPRAAACRRRRGGRGMGAVAPTPRGREDELSWPARR